MRLFVGQVTADMHMVSYRNYSKLSLSLYLLFNVILDFVSITHIFNYQS